MKTSEFIKLLQQEDPNDECEVCIDNYPVSWVDKMPWYYDGRLQLVEKDSKDEVISAGYSNKFPMKMKIHYDTLEDVLLDNPELELDLSGITYKGEINDRYLQSIEHWRKEGREYQAWYKDFKQKSDDAKKNNLPPPPIYTGFNSFKMKCKQWLKKLKLIS